MNASCEDISHCLYPEGEEEDDEEDEEDDD